MPDINRPDQPESEGYTPASPVKRALAWIGIVYMVILVFLTTYMYFSGGVALTGIAPLLAIPALIGLGIVAPGKGAAWGLAVACWLVAVWFLIPGIAGLMANFA